jgi:hypothetical protein
MIDDATRAKVREAMARAISGAPFPSHASMRKADAALTAALPLIEEACRPAGSFNVNEYVLVRLTEHGREIIRKDDAKWGELYPSLRGRSTLPKEDADGWSKWQLWHLMQTFGPHVANGVQNPFETTIRLPAPPSLSATEGV